MSANTLILHHYAPSPYSEKVRKVLAYKQIAWRSVEAPPVMPKPDQIALTGGYRKAPIMQLGHDIYCDSKLICRVIDRLKPEHALYPPGSEASTLITERWVDQAFFFQTVALFFQPQGMAAFAASLEPGMLNIFLKDRAAMFAQGGTQPAPKMDTARAELPATFAALEAQLAHTNFFGGDAPTQIDFSLYNPVWFVHANAGIAAELSAYPQLRAWADRIIAFGDGARSEMEGAEAVEICRATKTTQPPLPGAALALPQVKLGDTVKIGASDYAPDQVQGELVIANAHELAIRREDPRAGTVIVHFPPEGFTLVRA